MLVVKSNTAVPMILDPRQDAPLVNLQDANRFRQMVLLYRSGGLDEESFRRFRVQYGVYDIRNQPGLQMVRVKVPFGKLTALQLEALANVVENYAGGSCHVTTRQAIQFYGIPLERVPQALTVLSEVGLTTRESAGNVVRNVTADPLAGAAVDEVFDVRPYASMVARYFHRNPVSQNLGRKFKIAFSSSPSDRAYASIHDLGAIAAVSMVDGVLIPGFQILVGGGLGAHPRAAQLLEPFTPVELLLPTIEAVIRVFDRLGDRANRQKSRLKFLIEDIGLEKFAELVTVERKILLLVAPEPYPTSKDDPSVWYTEDPRSYQVITSKSPDEDESDFGAWQQANTIQQKQSSYRAVWIPLPIGNLTHVQLQVLADAVHTFCDGKITTTMTQDMVMKNVPEAVLSNLYLALQPFGLARTKGGQVAAIVSCPGAATCEKAITHSQQLGQDLHNYLERKYGSSVNAELADISIKISGCPNACGHHPIAAIGLHGASKRINGEAVPYYRLFLGGRVNEHGCKFGEQVATVPASFVCQAVEKVIDLFLKNRSTEEHFYEWLDRVTPASLEKELRTYTQPFPS